MKNNKPYQVSIMFSRMRKLAVGALSKLGRSITYLSNTNKPHGLTTMEAFLSAEWNNLPIVFLNLC